MEIVTELHNNNYYYYYTEHKVMGIYGYKLSKSAKPRQQHDSGNQWCKAQLLPCGPQAAEK